MLDADGDALIAFSVRRQNSCFMLCYYEIYKPEMTLSTEQVFAKAGYVVQFL